MQRAMNRKVMITCALTGAGDTVGRSEHVPVTPEQIAESGIAAARAGATIVHLHVRDPQTGQLRAPTPAESRALAPAPSSAAMRAPSPPALVTHPGGSRQVRLGERGLVYSVVTRGADGKLAGQCVHGPAAADNAVRAPAPTQPHTEHHHD